MKKIILADADIILHQFASVGEVRTILVTHLPSGRVKEFANRTSFRGRIKKDGTFGGWLEQTNISRMLQHQEPFKLEDFKIEDKQQAQPLAFSLHSLREHLGNTQEHLKAEELHLYLGQGEVHRSSILLPWDGVDGQGRKYKGQRKGLIKPVHLDAVRDYLTNVQKANIITGMEVDDYLAIKNYEGHLHYKQSGNVKDNPFVLHSIDKDSGHCSGWWYNPNWMEEPLYITGLGEIWKEGKDKIRMIGRKSLYGQLLSQDVADNIYPKRTPNGQKNTYSENKMFSELQPLQTDKECWELIANKYKEWFGEEEIEYKAWDGSMVRETWITWLQKHMDLYKMYRSHEGDRIDVVEKLNLYSLL